jgi:N-hydroxyarylamine O-acetyltransferase
MFDLAKYFARIGYDGPREATLDTLRALQALHPGAITFENLDPLLGRRVHLDLAALQQKLIANGRGGYCFEQNGLFAAVLESLDFRFTTLGARVVYYRPAGAPRSHMLLKVDLPEGSYLADVGFGGQTPCAPLRLDTTSEQQTPHGPFRVMPAGDGQYEVGALVDGEWRALYRFLLEPQTAEDHEMANWYVSTHPGSDFRARLFVARHPPGRRLTLLGNQFTIRESGGKTDTRTLRDAQEIATLLEQEFLINLPQPRSELMAAIERSIAS